MKSTSLVHMLKWKYRAVFLMASLFFSALGFAPAVFAHSISICILPPDDSIPVGCTTIIPAPRPTFHVYAAPSDANLGYPSGPPTKHGVELDASSDNALNTAAPTFATSILVSGTNQKNQLATACWNLARTYYPAIPSANPPVPAVQYYSGYTQGWWWVGPGVITYYAHKNCGSGGQDQSYPFKAPRNWGNSFYCAPPDACENNHV